MQPLLRLCVSKPTGECYKMHVRKIINFLSKLRIITNKTRQNAAGNNDDIIRYCLGVIDFEAFLKFAKHSICFIGRISFYAIINKSVLSTAIRYYLSIYSFKFKSLHMLGIQCQE